MGVCGSVSPESWACLRTSVMTFFRNFAARSWWSGVTERGKVARHWASWADTFAHDPTAPSGSCGGDHSSSGGWSKFPCLEAVQNAALELDGVVAGGLRPEPREPELHELGGQRAGWQHEATSWVERQFRATHILPESHAPGCAEVSERPSRGHPILSGTVVFLHQVGPDHLQGSASAAPLLTSAPVQTQLPVWPSP